MTADLVDTTARFPAERRVGASELMSAEWTKLRSIASTTWSLVAMVVVSVGLALIATELYTAQWKSLSASDRAHLISDPIGLILQPAASYGQVAICVLGVMVIASEFSTGTIRASLLAVPNRKTFLLAKACTFACLVFAVSLLVSVLSFIFGSRILTAHVRVATWDWTIDRAVLGFAMYMTVIGLFAFAVGTLLRHVAGAITATIALVIVLPVAVSALPGRVGDYISAYAPGGSAGQSIMSSGSDPTAVIGPWPGFLVMCSWTLLLLAAAVLRTMRSDVPTGAAA